MNVTNDSGSVQAVSLIDYKIRDHEEHIRELRQIRDFLTANQNGNSKAPAAEPQPASHYSPSSLPPKARQLWDWVKGHGPVTRKQIKDTSGMSSGTIANYLRPKYGFECVSHGVWDVVGANREQRH